MMTSRKKSESGRSVKGQRYWSLMLVGEHGRVIPFRRFKEVAIAIFAIALLSLMALVILGFFYLRQGKTIETLQTELNELRQYAGQLKDEKDVLNARLGIRKAQMAPDLETASNTSDETSTLQPAAGPASSEEKRPAAEASIKEKVAREPEPEKQKPQVVQWGADIRDISVQYDSNRKIVKASFRVYNTSVPKNKLAGRTVVVFKNKADPPIKWFAVPNVLLSNGQPNGKVGKAFNINNFITMRHYAYGLKRPSQYDAVAVFVFSADARLLASREFDFKIKPEPPPAPKPEPAKPAPEEAATPSTPPVSEDPKRTTAIEKQAVPENEAAQDAGRDGNHTDSETIVIEPVEQGSATTGTTMTPQESVTDVQTGGNETTDGETETIAPATEKKTPTP